MAIELTRDEYIVIRRKLVDEQLTTKDTETLTAASDKIRLIVAGWEAPKIGRPRGLEDGEARDRNTQR